MKDAILSEIDSIENIATAIAQGVTIFGSARTLANCGRYLLAQQIAQGLSESGFQVISGGGPGIMRAASEGAKRGNGSAIGFNILLPFEQPDYSLQETSLTFGHFFTRKLAFAKCSKAFIVLPGGMGTLDELFEMMTLIQTKKIEARPIILVDTKFWKGLFDWMHTELALEGYISEFELDSIALYDEADDVIAHIINHL